MNKTNKKYILEKINDFWQTYRKQKDFRIFNLSILFISISFILKYKRIKKDFELIDDKIIILLVEKLPCNIYLVNNFIFLFLFVMLSVCVIYIFPLIKGYFAFIGTIEVVIFYILFDIRKKNHYLMIDGISKIEKYIRTGKYI